MSRRWWQGVPWLLPAGSARSGRLWSRVLSGTRGARSQGMQRSAGCRAVEVMSQCLGQPGWNRRKSGVSSLRAHSCAAQARVAPRRAFAVRRERLAAAARRFQGHGRAGRVPKTLPQRRRHRSGHPPGGRRHAAAPTASSSSLIARGPPSGLVPRHSRRLRSRPTSAGRRISEWRLPETRGSRPVSRQCAARGRVGSRARRSIPKPAARI